MQQIVAGLKAKFRQPRTPGQMSAGAGPGSSTVAAAQERVRAADPVAARERYSGIFASWQMGELRPWSITNLLNAHGFVGDWVDAAVGVDVPILDLVEAGRIYPSWSLLVKIAALADTTPDTLFDSPGTPPTKHDRCSRDFIAYRFRDRYPDPIVQFTLRSAHATPTDDDWRRAHEDGLVVVAAPLIDVVRTHGGGEGKTDLEIAVSLR